MVRAVLRLARRLRQSAPARELTGGGLSLLAALHRGGPSSAAALARSEGLQPQSLTRLLTRMVADGLIERPVDAADRRRHKIQLTARGRSALDWAMNTRRKRLAELMDERLTAAERNILLRAAELMLKLAA